MKHIVGLCDLIVGGLNRNRGCFHMCKACTTLGSKVRCSVQQHPQTQSLNASESSKFSRKREQEAA